MACSKKSSGKESRLVILSRFSAIKSFHVTWSYFILLKRIPFAMLKRPIWMGRPIWRQNMLLSMELYCILISSTSLKARWKLKSQAAICMSSMEELSFWTTRINFWPFKTFSWGKLILKTLQKLWEWQSTAGPSPKSWWTKGTYLANSSHI